MDGAGFLLLGIHLVFATIRGCRGDTNYPFEKYTDGNTESGVQGDFRTRLHTQRLCFGCPNLRHGNVCHVVVVVVSTDE